jgi:hypothetical protein
MSYQQGNMAYPPQGQQQAYVAPPAGYPQPDQQYPAAAGGAVETTSRGHHHNGGGFWRGW